MERLFLLIELTVWIITYPCFYILTWTLDFLFWLICKIPFGNLLRGIWWVVQTVTIEAFQLVFRLLTGTFFTLQPASATGAPGMAPPPQTAPTNDPLAGLSGAAATVWWVLSWSVVSGIALFLAVAMSQAVHFVFPSFRPKHSIPFLFISSGLALFYNKLKQDDVFIPTCMAVGLAWVAVSAWLHFRTQRADAQIAAARAPERMPRAPVPRAGGGGGGGGAKSDDKIKVFSLVHSLKSQKIRVDTGTSGAPGPVVYSELSSCAICLDTFPDVVTVLACGHAFCPECIKEWWEIRHVCAVCKTPSTNLGFLVNKLFT